MIALYIYFLGFVATWILSKFIEVKFFKLSDRKEKWDFFKFKCLVSIFSWVGLLGVVILSIIFLIHTLSEDRDPPKWL